MNNPLEKQIQFMLSLHSRLEKRFDGEELKTEFYDQINEMIEKGILSEAIRDIANLTYNISSKPISKKVPTPKSKDVSFTKRYDSGCSSTSSFRSGC